MKAIASEYVKCLSSPPKNLLMSLGKKLVIIAQLALLNAVWLLNIAIYQKYNYFSEARHLSYMPENTLLCGSVRTADLAGKLAYEFLYHREVFDGYFKKHELKSLAETSPFKMGLDPNDQVSFFVEQEKDQKYVHVGLFIDLLNADDLHGYLAKNKWKKAGGKTDLTVFENGKGMYAVHDGEVAMFIRFDKHVAAENAMKVVDRIYKNAGSNKKIHKTLVKYLKQNHDVVLAGHAPEAVIQTPLLSDFVITGEFVGDKITLDGDFMFKQNMEAVFPEHKMNSEYNFDDLDAFFVLQSNFDLPNADLLPENLGLITFNDSLANLLKRTLHSRECTKLQFMADKFKNLDASKNEHISEETKAALNVAGMGIMVPEFIFAINCVQAKKMDSLLHVLSVTDSSFHSSDEGFFRFTVMNSDIYMKAENGVFTVQSNRDMHQAKFPETGYSNFIYFDYNKMRSAIPNVMARTMAADYDVFKHMFGYSTSCTGKLVTAKGEVVIEKGKVALLELFKTDDKILQWTELRDMFMRKKDADDE